MFFILKLNTLRLDIILFGILHVEDKVDSLDYVRTKHQLDDILTKPSNSIRFEFLRKSLSIWLND